MNGPIDGQQFASDNYSGICPEALEAMLAANRGGHAPAYGDDAWTARATDLFRELFETDCEVFFTFNGTAANSLALASLCQSYHSIVCAETAHIETDECGAPEFYSNGAKLLLGHARDGKLAPGAIRERVAMRSDIHYPRPRAVSIAQATELGTVYGIDELLTIQAVCKAEGLALHMDGARFANAVAALGCKPREIAWQAGVDVLCFGGTKNGMAVGEAVVFFDRRLAEDFAYRCKQAGQLASKMRFIAAPWIGLLESGAWLRHAAHANACAQRLVDGLAALDGAALLAPAQANGVFVRLPEAAQARLRAAGWRFYTFIGNGARFMCGWDIGEASVDALLADIREALAA